MVAQGIQDASDANLETEIAGRPGLTLVDFWAPWCAPCRTIAPLLEELAGDYEGEVAIVKVNADENPDASAKHGVRGLPTLILFRDGTEIERLTGAVGKTRISTVIDRHLAA